MIKLKEKLIRTYAVDINGEKYIHVRSLDSLIVTVKNWLKNRGEK